MDKRLAKRHKRQVERARQKVRISEPDVRTPEQIAAAKEASRPEVTGKPHPWPSLHSDAGAAKAAEDAAPAPNAEPPAAE